MNDPFDNLSFEEEINPQRWSSETRLHTPTFEALLKEDGTLYLTGPALQEGFSVADVQALTRFLSERVHLPPVEPPPEDPEDFSNVAASTFLQIVAPSCVTCGQAVANFTECYRCGKPVHMDNNEKCGAWLLDSWHDEAATDNAFWCSACLKEEQQEESAPSDVVIVDEIHLYSEEEPEKANTPPTMRYLEIRLYQPQWHHLDELKAAMPALHEQYEAPTCRETGGPVKVLSVKYEQVTPDALALLNTLQLDYRIFDELVPMAGEEEEK
jgi:hypothetical protein